ncbi:MAG: protein phosphatase 2C domain-containing protein [Pyrinomonadaceae bacterium]|nr:protein phosphatase 2C domain-containing protein [Pyrinomonadaceae bacterium]
MVEEPHTTRWQVVGHSVRGASHERSGAPNQDAIYWLPQSGTGSRLILTMADGHGGAKHFRSAVGARLAVETAAQVSYDFLAGAQAEEAGSLSAIKRAAEEWLPKMLVRNWLEAVEHHKGSHPLLEAERDLLHAGDVSSSLPLAYGATLLVAVVAESFILYMQLGDGEILTVSSEGAVSRPLPKDERLFANETTSLCAPDAWRDFRICFQALSQTPPAVILLSTDGYSNSFRDESGFLKVGSDILEMIRADGLSQVKENMEAWLLDSTRAGSGDDITLGIICRTDVTQSSPSNGVLNESDS